MANGVAVFALLCSIAAVVFGVWRYRQVRAATRAAARDRMDAWRAEMAVFEAQATQAAASQDEVAAVAQPDPSVVDSAIEVSAEVALDASEKVNESVESDALGAPGVRDEQAPVDVRAEMDAFFGSAPAAHRPESGGSNPAHA